MFTGILVSLIFCYISSLVYFFSFWFTGLQRLPLCWLVSTVCGFIGLFLRFSGLLFTGFHVFRFSGSLARDFRIPENQLTSKPINHETKETIKLINMHTAEARKPNLSSGKPEKPEKLINQKTSKPEKPMVLSQKRKLQVIFLIRKKTVGRLRFAKRSNFSWEFFLTTLWESVLGFLLFSFCASFFKSVCLSEHPLP